MDSLRFLSVEDVLACHVNTIREDGGSEGIRDLGLLESAVAMPRATFGGQYLHASLPEMAAAYLFHLCQAHAFVDGNKRTAVLACHMFLDVNGWEFDVEPDALFETVIQVADSQITKSGLMQRMPRMIQPRRDTE